MTLLGARLVYKTTGAIQRQSNFLSAEDSTKSAKRLAGAVTSFGVRLRPAMSGRLAPYRETSDIFRKGRIASAIDFPGLLRDISASTRPIDCRTGLVHFRSPFVTSFAIYREGFCDIFASSLAPRAVVSLIGFSDSL